MAKKNGAAEMGDNIKVDLSALKQCVKRVENILDEIATIKADYMNRCKELRDDMKEVYSDAKDKGLATRAVKTLIFTRIQRARIQQAIENLEADLQADYEMYADAIAQWEETPLAKAAKRPTQEEVEAEA